MGSSHGSESRKMTSRPEFNKYAEELKATAAAISAPGKGILAADESSGTIGKRFSHINVENNQDNRRAYREMLFTTPGLGEFISGAITFEETLFDVARDGSTMLVDLLKKQGIIPGIKVDKGVQPLFGTSGETVTQGIDDLGKRCAKYYEAGARFAKWRAVLNINDDSGTTPSPSPSSRTRRRWLAMLPFARPMDSCPLWSRKFLWMAHTPSRRRRLSPRR